VAPPLPGGATPLRPDCLTISPHRNSRPLIGPKLFRYRAGKAISSLAREKRHSPPRPANTLHCAHHAGRALPRAGRGFLLSLLRGDLLLLRPLGSGRCLLLLLKRFLASQRRFLLRPLLSGSRGLLLRPLGGSRGCLLLLLLLKRLLTS